MGILLVEFIKKSCLIWKLSVPLLKFLIPKIWLFILSPFSTLPDHFSFLISFESLVLDQGNNFCLSILATSLQDNVWLSWEEFRC